MYRSNVNLALQTCILGVAFFILASASIALTRFEGGVAFLWPATAPLLAFLAVRLPREWPYPVAATLIASWLSSWFFGAGPVTGIPIAFAIVGEALIAATILRSAGDKFYGFDSLTSLGIFVFAAGGIAPMLSAFVGAWAIAGHPGQLFWPNWRAWYAAHSLGTVSLAPLLLLSLRGEAIRWVRNATRRRQIEALLLLGTVVATSCYVFGQARLPLLFLPLLPLLLATFRLGRIGATMSVVILAAIGGALTIRGNGPISLIHTSIGGRAQFFQFYLTVAVFMVLPVAADLKRRTALVSQLKASEASYRLVADSLGDTIIHTSLDGDVRFASTAIVDLTGYEAVDVLGRNSRDFVLPEDLAAFEAARDAAIADSERTISIEYRARVRNDVVIWCETRMRSYLDAHDMAGGVILVVRDATERKAMEAELALEARTDALTGIPNRRAFFRRLDYVQGEVEAGQAIECVALLDLDLFKQVNDSHGHATGDLLLQTISSILTSIVRSSDMVARVGGEEFGLVLWGTDLDQAVHTCDRVLAAIAGCSIISSGGLTVRATTSIGIALIEQGRTSAILYEDADRALYEAKSTGRNRLRIAA